MTSPAPGKRREVPLDFDGLRPQSPFMTAEHDAWRTRVRAFVDAHVVPHIDAWDAAGTFPDALYVTAAREGLLGFGFSEAFGGHSEQADP